MNNKIRLIAVCVLVLVAASVALAQKNNRPGKESRQMVKAYIEQNILPVAIEERNDFESILTISEKEKINELRERKQALRAKNKANMEEFGRRRGDGNDVRPEPTDEQLAEMRMARKERRLITTEAFEIIDNHEDFFIAMENDLKDERTKWRNDVKAMIEVGNENAERPERGEMRKRGDGRHGGAHHGGRNGRSAHRGKMDKMFTPVAFLLMDPANPQFAEGPGDINIYPNPASGKQTIAIDLQEASIVKVKLIDTDGKILETLFNGNLVKGSNDIEVDLSERDGQQYFYKITTPNGTKTKRVLLKN